VAPAIAVVVPTRDRRRLLLRTLGTVRAQRGIDLEVIVVDDGSADGSGEAVLDLGDPRISVVRHAHAGGVSAARNAGLAEVRAPWVAFLDDDDLWAPDKLASQLAVAADAPHVGWVCAGAVTVNRALRVVSGTMPPDAEVVAQLPAFNSIPGGGSGTIARTDLVREVGGFDLALGNLADWDLWIRLAAEAPLGAVHRPLTGYLRHPASLSHDLTDVREEFEHTRRKHARARDGRGLPDSTRTLEWFVYRQVQAGKRRAAATAYLDLWHRYRSPKALRRAAIGLLAPAAMRRRRDRASLRRLPGWWVDEAETWLAPLRRQAEVEAPSDGVVTTA
jgi:glycosyltransferase involved in cell wall biosynthesis